MSSNSTMAQHVANVLNRDSVQQIIDHCQMANRLNTLTRTETAIFHLAAINLAAILEMQTKEEKIDVFA